MPAMRFAYRVMTGSSTGPSKQFGEPLTCWNPPRHPILRKETDYSDPFWYRSPSPTVRLRAADLSTHMETGEFHLSIAGSTDPYRSIREPRATTSQPSRSIIENPPSNLALAGVEQTPHRQPTARNPRKLQYVLALSPTIEYHERDHVRALL